MNKRYALLLLLLTIIFVSCNDENGNNPDPLELASVYVTNEGNFSDSNGSVTSYDPETGATLKKAFEDANGRPIAGIVQSAEISGDRMFIVLNNANKIEVVDVKTFESIATVELSKDPTDVEVIDEETAYVSNLFEGSISIIDLVNYEETEQTIQAGSQPRSILRFGNFAYVANNGSGNDNTVSVINIADNTIEDTIEVGPGPDNIVADESGRLWVVCNGLIAYDENWERDPANDKPGSIYLIDGNSATVTDSIKTGGHPSGIALDNSRARAYLLNGGIFEIDMNTLTVAEDTLATRSFNAIGYFPEQDRLYAGDSKGYSQDGQVLIYNLQGTAVDSFNVGIAPNGFKFVVN